MPIKFLVLGCGGFPLEGGKANSIMGARILLNFDCRLAISDYHQGRKHYLINSRQIQVGKVIIFYKYFNINSPRNSPSCTQKHMELPKIFHLE